METETGDTIKTKNSLGYFVLLRGDSRRSSRMERSSPCVVGKPGYPLLHQDYNPGLDRRSLNDVSFACGHEEI